MFVRNCDRTKENDFVRKYVVNNKFKYEIAWKQQTFKNMSKKDMDPDPSGTGMVISDPDPNIRSRIQTSVNPNQSIQSRGMIIPDPDPEIRIWIRIHNSGRVGGWNAGHGQHPEAGQGEGGQGQPGAARAHPHLGNRYMEWCVTDPDLVFLAIPDTDADPTLKKPGQVIS